MSSSSSAIGYSIETDEVPVYLETYPVSRLDDERKKRFSKILLHLAFFLLCRRCFVGDDSSAAMPTLFPSADATITKRLGVRGIEVIATALGALDSAFLGIWFLLLHRPRLRCNSAKLTRPCLLETRLSAPGKETPCIDAATAQPTTQSNQ
jgi:hypothetical protein